MSTERLAYTLSELPEAGVPEAIGRRAINEGRLKAHRMGTTVVVLAQDLHAFLSDLPSAGPPSAADAEARRLAKIQHENEQRARGRAIAEQALGKAPANPPRSASERERERQERVAQEQAARARGRAIVEKATGKRS